MSDGAGADKGAGQTENGETLRQLHGVADVQERHVAAEAVQAGEAVSGSGVGDDVAHDLRSGEGRTDAG